MHGKILAGEFPRKWNAVDLPDRGDEPAKKRTALEQRHQTSETRSVSCGGKSGETAADDGNFTDILEGSHFKRPFRYNRDAAFRRLGQIARRSATAQGTDGNGATPIRL
jgi:hypothetical protein